MNAFPLAPEALPPWLAQGKFTRALTFPGLE